MFDVGDKVIYQPKGKGTRRYEATIREVHKDGSYDVMMSGQFYFVPNDQSLTAVKKRRGCK